MTNLEKVLVKKGLTNEQAGQELVNETKLLLATNAKEEIDMLTSIGLDGDLKMIMAKQQDVIIRKENGEKLNCSIIHASEIHALCKQYRLYFKHASQYQGSVPPELARELINWTKDKRVAVGAQNSTNLFYVIAPPSMFKGYRSALGVLHQAWAEHDIAVKEERRRREEDPILVYKLDQYKDYYAIVKSWGDDLSPLRELYAFCTRRTTAYFLWFLGYIAVASTTLFTIIKTVSWAASHQVLVGKVMETSSGWRWTGGLLALVIALAGIFVFGTMLAIRKYVLNQVTREEDQNYRLGHPSNWSN